MSETFYVVIYLCDWLKMHQNIFVNIRDIGNGKPQDPKVKITSPNLNKSAQVPDSPGKHCIKAINVGVSREVHFRMTCTSTRARCSWKMEFFRHNEKI